MFVKCSKLGLSQQIMSNKLLLLNEAVSAEPLMHVDHVIQYLYSLVIYDANNVYLFIRKRLTCHFKKKILN